MESQTVCDCTHLIFMKSKNCLHVLERELILFWFSFISKSCFSFTIIFVLMCGLNKLYWLQRQPRQYSFAFFFLNIFLCCLCFSLFHEMNELMVENWTISRFPLWPTSWHSWCKNTFIEIPELLILWSFTTNRCFVKKNQVMLIWTYQYDFFIKIKIDGTKTNIPFRTMT